MDIVKTLSHSESKYKYLGLTKKARAEFPEKDKIFKLKFKGKIYDMKVNNKDCIMISQLYHRKQFQENDQVKITKEKGNFIFSVNE